MLSSRSLNLLLLKQTFALLILLFGVMACSPNAANTDELQTQQHVPIDIRQGTRFFKVTEKHFKAPKVSEITLPIPADGAAIWGATGRDRAGNIYVGVSTYKKEDRTAYLFQHNPETGTTSLHGDVLSQLKRLDIFRPGMGQSKLHSKFYQANDGYIYFSSFDEQGETGEINPQWGGHLWRKLPASVEWEHVLASEEALIAVNTTGRYIYSLGYWDHVLYQYDTISGSIKKVAVGSVSGHISRNFLVDINEHAFVPRVSYNQFEEIETHLIEYDEHLNEVAKYSMPEYRDKKMRMHHGIVGYTPMANGDIFFTTSKGNLYQLKLDASSDDKLVSLGYFHPQGEAYIPSLFSVDGQNFVFGVASTKGDKQRTWLIRETQSNVNVSYPFPDTPIKSLLYGTLTVDNNGSFYIVGTDVSNSKKHRPVVFRLSY
jgi:hypothetical protein